MIDWRSRLLISERLFIRTDVAVIILSTRAPPSMRARALAHEWPRSPRGLASVCLPLSIVLLLSNPRTHDVRTVATLCRPAGRPAERERARNTFEEWESRHGKGDADEVTGQRPVPPPALLILRHHPSIDDGVPQAGYCLSRSPHSLTAPPPSSSVCTAYNAMAPAPYSTRTTGPTLASLSRPRRSTRVYARRARVCAMVTRHKSDSREISAPSCFSPLSFIGRTGAAC